MNDDTLILSRKNPMPSGRRFVELRHTLPDGRTLHYGNVSFYIWRSTHYEEVPMDTIKRSIYDFLEVASAYDKDGNLVPFCPNRSLVGEVIETTKCAAYLEISPPAWIGEEGGEPPADEMIACRNGLLHYPTRTLYPHTPRFFTTNTLNFDYDPDAKAHPNWQKFLDDLWDDDIQSIGTLQEFMGYCLTADTMQQVIFLLVGPKRSGKGTIAAVLTDLMGAANVCNPTLASLSTNFGLSPLIGKRLSITGDVRLGSRTDTHALSERLRSNSGTDGITIDRKHREAWTGKLGIRFLLLA